VPSPHRLFSNFSTECELQNGLENISKNKKKKSQKSPFENISNRQIINGEKSSPVQEDFSITLHCKKAW
jgi:hypothetical protein